MSVSDPRHCPECGSDTYQAQGFERQLRRASRLQGELERQAMHHAAEVARLKILLMDAKEEKSWLQSKTHKQRLQLNRLEKKLRARGQQPYAKEE